jgi:hypothetical protein
MDITIVQAFTLKTNIPPYRRACPTESFRRGCLSTHCNKPICKKQAVSTFETASAYKMVQKVKVNPPRRAGNGYRRGHGDSLLFYIHHHFSSPVLIKKVAKLPLRARLTIEEKMAITIVQAFTLKTNIPPYRRACPTESFRRGCLSPFPQGLFAATLPLHRTFLKYFFKPVTQTVITSSYPSNRQHHAKGITPKDRNSRTDTDIHLHINRVYL